MTSPRPTAAAFAAALALALGSGCAAPTLTAASPSTAGPSATGPTAASPTAASPSSAAASPTVAASPTGTVIAAAAVGAFGTILVSSHGRTIYLSDRDTSTSSTCYGACAGRWLPVTTAGAPVAARGVDDGLIGTAVRSDGRTQVLYNGHPLYYFAGDAARGDTNGADTVDFDTIWHVVSDQGSKAES